MFHSNSLRNGCVISQAILVRNKTLLSGGKHNSSSAAEDEDQARHDQDDRTLGPFRQIDDRRQAALCPKGKLTTIWAPGKR